MTRVPPLGPQSGTGKVLPGGGAGSAGGGHGSGCSGPAGATRGSAALRTDALQRLGALAPWGRGDGGRHVQSAGGWA